MGKSTTLPLDLIEPTMACPQRRCKTAIMTETIINIEWESPSQRSAKATSVTFGFLPGSGKPPDGIQRAEKMNRDGVLDICQMVDGRLILREAAVTYLGIELADLLDAGPPPIPRVTPLWYPNCP